jgi:hypothetical protein
MPIQEPARLLLLVPKLSKHLAPSSVLAWNRVQPHTPWCPRAMSHTTTKQGEQEVVAKIF